MKRIAPPLTGSYRLQLNADFTLGAAEERVPYLRSLGISHLYLSPVFTARGGSTHGYDVADPTLVSEALGGEQALRSLADAVHRHEMGMLLDIVPNHMGIGPDNPFWDDVLARGEESRFAGWFDVSWRATPKRTRGRVLLPVLGDTLETVIERGEIGLDVRDAMLRVVYFDHHFPLDPATITPELESAWRDPTKRSVLRSWTAGAPGRDRLRALLGAQHYQLAYWRTASRDLNYRRFFDVNELICLRVEREDVFETTHATVLRLVSDGVI
ncbi:MAG: malto-oligosyltrehalose synthase, partial [Gemmatimonadaceae bacterium]|nr:malto-oligosyltrehalose synthase [Gemmatimonadaceae bacterium]